MNSFEASDKVRSRSSLIVNDFREIFRIEFQVVFKVCLHDWLILILQEGRVEDADALEKTVVYVLKERQLVPR